MRLWARTQRVSDGTWSATLGARQRRPKTPPGGICDVPPGVDPRSTAGAIAGAWASATLGRDGARPESAPLRATSCGSTRRSPRRCSPASLGLLAVGRDTRVRPRRSARPTSCSTALASLPLVARRRRRSPCSSFTALASTALHAVAEPAGPPLGPTLALYWLAAGSRRLARAGAADGRAGRARCSSRTWRRAASQRTASRGRRSCSASSSGAAPGWPATARGCAASGWPSSRSARCAPSARPSASAAWRPPRSARGSPATCTTRPATRST